MLGLCGHAAARHGSKGEHSERFGRDFAQNDAAKGWRRTPRSIGMLLYVCLSPSISRTVWFRRRRITWIIWSLFFLFSEKSLSINSLAPYCPQMLEMAMRKSKCKERIRRGSAFSVCDVLSFMFTWKYISTMALLAFRIVDGRSMNLPKTRTLENMRMFVFV